MNFVHKIPFFRLCILIYRNGGLSAKGCVHLIPWLIKTILLEPLRWVELLRFGNRIRKHRIMNPPVFILGHYRSGTTYLQRMFIQDQRFGYTSLFQTVLPEIMLLTERTLTPLFDSISKLFGIKNHFHRMPLTWSRFPGEEDVGMTALLQPSASQWGQLFPARNKFYLDNYILFRGEKVSIQQWKDDYQFYLKKISLQNKSKPLVLKNPPNTARIKVLLSLFPDARFIHIMRNPSDVFASTRNLRKVIRVNYGLGPCDENAEDERIINNYKAIMDQYLLEKELIPSEQLIEIAYEDFIHEPLSTLQSIYQHLALPSFNDCKNHMHALSAGARSYKMLRHQLSPECRLRIEKEFSLYTHYWRALLKYPVSGTISSDVKTG